MKKIMSEKRRDQFNKVNKELASIVEMMENEDTAIPINRINDILENLKEMEREKEKKDRTVFYLDSVSNIPGYCNHISEDREYYDPCPFCGYDSEKGIPGHDFKASQKEAE